MEKVITLENIFSGDWQDKEIKNLVELLNADYDSLSERGKHLRSLAVKLVHNFERKPVNTAGDARDLIEGHHLPVRNGKWVIVALNSQNEKHYTRTKNGLRLVHFLSNTFPSIEEMVNSAPLPENGKYIVIYGGNLAVLNNPEVIKAWGKVKNKLPIADILFCEDNSGVLTYWSIGAGAGQMGNSVVELPHGFNKKIWSLNE